VPQLDGPEDLKYFQALDDDWVWDQDEINPSEVDKIQDPSEKEFQKRFEKFSNQDFSERDKADRDADLQYMEDHKPSRSDKKKG